MKPIYMLRKNDVKELFKILKTDPDIEIGRTLYKTGVKNNGKKVSCCCYKAKINGEETYISAKLFDRLVAGQILSEDERTET